MSQLGIADYIVFGVMVLCSTGIGVYFIIIGKGQKTDGEYLMANRQMGFFPVSLSLIASFLSAISMMGVPAETYLYGTQYFICAAIGCIGMTAVMAHIVLPVLYPMKLTSVYEYLQRRFHPIVRICVTTTFILHILIYVGIVLYAPALALDAVTGVSWHICVGAVCVLTLVYTVLGGLKAVIWTDAFQLLVMFVGYVAIIIKSSVRLGGIGEVFARMSEGNRVEFFNMDASLTTRTTLWSGSAGLFLMLLFATGLAQPFAQRYFSCRSLRDATIAAWLNCLGYIVMTGICVLAGACAYAFYADCDPLTTGRISRPDQILALLVVESMSDLPGFTGLFISCIFCASLSTLSSQLNSLSAIVLRDIYYPIKKMMKDDPGKENDEPNDSSDSKASKIMAASFGVIGLGMAFLASALGNILQVGNSLALMVETAPIILFCMGILLRFVNWKGAMAGLFSGQIVGIWLGVGSFVVGGSASDRAPLSTAGCVNATTIATTTYLPNVTMSGGLDPPFSVYGISYYLQGVASCIVTIVVMCIASLITGMQDRNTLQEECIWSRFRKTSKKQEPEKV